MRIGCGWRQSAAVFSLRRPADLPLSNLDRTAVFLAIAFACERRFQAALLAGRNIEGVSFDFADDVFLLHLALEATKRAFERFVVAKFDFCHLLITCLSMSAMVCLASSLPIGRRRHVASGVVEASGKLKRSPLGAVKRFSLCIVSKIRGGVSLAGAGRSRKIRLRKLSAIFLPGIFLLPPIFERIPRF
jgi:hypothetical protein